MESSQTGSGRRNQQCSAWTRLAGHVPSWPVPKELSFRSDCGFVSSQQMGQRMAEEGRGQPLMYPRDVLPETQEFSGTILDNQEPPVTESFPTRAGVALDPSCPIRQPLAACACLNSN